MKETHVFHSLKTRITFGKRSALFVIVLDSNLLGLLKEMKKTKITKWELLVILLENFYIRLVRNYTAFRSRRS